MTERRRFSGGERTALYLAADGACEGCGAELEPGWHADHVQPHSRGGPTKVTNGQALCPTCNLKKGSRMARTLLTWQREALDQYRRAVNPARFLIAAFPGMGKTEAAAAILAETGRYGIVLTPQADTLPSWRATLHGRGICPAATVSRDGTSVTCASCKRRVGAAVMTYDFAAANPTVIAKLYAAHGPSLLIVDEVHHLRSQGAWAAPLVAVQPYIDSVLALSATPFRTDEEPVPFVHTEGPWSREARPLADDYVVEYSYGRALTALKPPPVNRAIFQRFDADVTWLESDVDGEMERSAILSEANDRDTARKARRHAVDARGDWVATVVRDADGQLQEARATDMRAGGLIVCRDTNHAVAMADRLVRETVGDVAVYTQDYATLRHQIGQGREGEDGRRAGHDSGDVLSTYGKSDHKWIVTVRKISEGVDVPRLRVLVYATVTRTRLFFIQVLGRVIRVVRELPKDVDQTAWVYIPDDADMRGYAAEVEDGIADAEIAAYEEEDEAGGDRKRERETSEATTKFISSEAQYTGATVDGENHEPELMALAIKIGEAPSDALRFLRKLHVAGHLDIEGKATPESTYAEQGTLFDPVSDLAEKIKSKDDAVRSWAGLRLRAGEFGKFGLAAKACHTQLGELFNVWASNRDVTVDQVEKATAYTREQIKVLRSG